jgi:pyruvate dehydrogenase E2 component (dihydrolipoamide acetyltransferase)
MGNLPEIVLGYGVLTAAGAPGPHCSGWPPSRLHLTIWFVSHLAPLAGFRRPARVLLDPTQPSPERGVICSVIINQCTMASLIPPCLSVPTAPGRARLAAPGAPRRRRMAVVRAKIREIFMPALSSTMMEGKIVSWTAAEGDRVGKGDPVVVVESDKADMDVETFHDGIVAVVLVPAGGTAPVGAPIALLAESEEEVALARARAQALSQGQSQAPSPPHAAAALGPPPPAPVAPPATKGIATPYAKKLAKQHRVDIAGVVGTGPHGRVTAADVEAAAGIKHKRPPPPPPPASVDAAPLVPASAVLPPVPGGTVVPFTTMQAAVSKNMVESLRVPTFRVSYSMITDKLDALYEKVQFSIDLRQSVGFHTSTMLY